MTRNETNDFQVLTEPQEQLEQRRLEVEAKLHAEPNGIAPTRPRKTRSDRGVAKGPKLVKQAPQGAAVLSADQAAELKALAEAMIASARDLADAQRKNLQAAVAYAAYVDALTK